MRVVIVGGGVVGAALALAVARRGLDVVLMDGARERSPCARVWHHPGAADPGTLEHAMLARAAELRPLLDALGVARDGDRFDAEAAAVALRAAAERHGAQVRRERFAHPGQVRGAVYVNCAGRGAEAVARGLGDAPFAPDASYVVGRSPVVPELINVAALGTTGASAALALAEHVAGLIAPGMPEAPLRPPSA